MSGFDESRMTDPKVAFEEGYAFGVRTERERIAAIIRGFNTPAGARLLRTLVGEATMPVKFEIPPGTRPAACRSCQAPIFWVKTASQKNMPVDPDGTSHFATCPEAAKHRRPR